MGFRKGAVIGIAAAVFTTTAAAGGGVAALFAFRDALAAKAGQGVPWMAAELICETTLGMETGPAGRDLVFIGAIDGGAELWALSGFPILDLDHLWTGGPLGDDPAMPPTAEWGWVYDRDGDGAIDWLAVVDSPRAILPEGADPATLPDLRALPPDLPEATAAEIGAERRLAYWHLADETGDRRPDALIALPVQVDTGWTEGAMRIALDGDAVTGCLWRPDHDPARSAPCVARAGGFETTGPGPVLRAEAPLAYLTAMFELVTGAAAACDFGPPGIETRP